MRRLRLPLFAITILTLISGYAGLSASLASPTNTRSDQTTRATFTQVQAFFTTMAPYAQAEQAQYGIPASMALAVAADETGYGTNVFSRQNNDYFNVTCGANGGDYTESPRATGVVYNGSYCYVTFANTADSFLDWGYFLTHDTHYTNLTGYFGSTPNVDGAIAALYTDGYAGTDNIGIVQAIHDGNNLLQFNGAPVPSGTCSLSSCIVDESDPGFSWTGPITTPARNDSAVGYMAHSLWSPNCGPGATTDCVDGTSSDVIGSWTPNIPQAGMYEVDAAIPATHATTHNAVYSIRAGGGQTFTATVNQDAYPPTGSAAPYAWVSLGSYTFDAGTDGLVALSDQTGEPYATKDVAWNAIRFVSPQSLTMTPVAVAPTTTVTTTSPTPVASVTGTVTATGTVTTTATITAQPTMTPTVIPIQTPSTPPIVGPTHLTVALTLPRNNLCLSAPVGVHVLDKPYSKGTLTLALTQRVWYPVRTRHHDVHYLFHTKVLYKRSAHVATSRGGAAVYITGLPCLLPKPAYATLKVSAKLGHSAVQISVPFLVYKRPSGIRVTGAHQGRRQGAQHIQRKRPHAQSTYKRRHYAWATSLT